MPAMSAFQPLPARRLRWRWARSIAGVATVDGGGPGRNSVHDLARAELEGAAPGTEPLRCQPVESSPIGGR